MKLYYISCPIYNATILLFTGPREIVHKWFERHDITIAINPDSYMEAGQFNPENATDKKFYLWVGDFKQNAEDVACAIHEFFHVVSLILLEVGIKHNNETEEAYAYLLSWLSAEVFKRLFKYTK